MQLLQEQQAAGFSDVAGTLVSATVPLSDRLLTRIAVERLPPTAPIRAFDVRAHPEGRLTVRVRLARPAFLPTLTFPITILRQPELPHTPVLLLRLGSPGGILKLAGPLVQLVDVLPPGISLQGDRVAVNLHAILAEAGVAFALDFLEHLDVATAEGKVVVSVRARVPGGDAVPPRSAAPRSAEL